mmetsp:Transcript_75027/g.232880  ORF Transcript_75027/g.232880 Transcript_75027/m.232880 type:complete len:193 (+) Transcript_75027:673-1251(+)
MAVPWALLPRELSIDGPDWSAGDDWARPGARTSGDAERAAVAAALGAPGPVRLAAGCFTAAAATAGLRAAGVGEVKHLQRASGETCWREAIGGEAGRAEGAAGQAIPGPVASLGEVGRRQAGGEAGLVPEVCSRGEAAQRPEAGTGEAGRPKVQGGCALASRGEVRRPWDEAGFSPTPDCPGVVAMRRAEGS